MKVEALFSRRDAGVADQHESQSPKTHPERKF